MKGILILVAIFTSPLKASFGSCPVFLIKQNLEKFGLGSDAQTLVCGAQLESVYFQKAEGLESFLQSHPKIGLGRSKAVSFDKSCFPDPTDEKIQKAVISEYHYRLHQIAAASVAILQRTAWIESVLGKPLLHDINCNISEIPEARKWCEYLKGTPGLKGCAPRGGLEHLAQESRQIFRIFQNLEIQKSKIIDPQKKKEIEGRLTLIRQFYPWIVPWFERQDLKSQIKLYQTLEFNIVEVLRKQFESDRIGLIRKLASLRTASQCLEYSGPGDI